MPAQMVSTSLPIETPEGITFEYELASLSSRCWAFLIDLAIRAGVLLVVGMSMVALGPLAKAGAGVWMLVYFVLEWGYYVVFEVAMNGQSVGKRALSLRVVKVQGNPIGFFDSLLRNLLRGADILPGSYAVGVISVLATRRFQRLGDLAAGTIVIQEKRTWFAGKAPHVDPRLAQGGHRGVVLSNRERRMLEEFVLRKDRLHPERCEQIAQILAEPYRRRFNLPAGGSATELLARLYAATAENRP